jgi:RecG-like helicase
MPLDDFALFKISLSFSIIGIFLLLIFSIQQEYLRIEIENVSKELIGKKVLITGIIEKEFLKNNVLIFWVSKNSKKIKGVIFNPSSEELFLIRKGSKVMLKGKIQEFKKELEIIVEKVIALNE